MSSLVRTASIFFNQPLAFIAILTLNLIFSPFNKVEESFFIQATHDLLNYPFWNDQLSDFDHFEYPGVVPRTFIGPLLLFGPSFVVGSFMEWFASLVGAIEDNHLFRDQFWYLIATRFVLATYMAISLLWINLKLSRPHQKYFVAICVAQFHLMFWGSRTIANVFACVGFNFALGFFIDAESSLEKSLDSIDSMMICLSFVCIIFRAELVPLSGFLILYSMKRFHYPLARAFKTGILSSIVFISTTVLVDSYFWQRWVWPEFEVFVFNGVQGKSVEWGTMPWYSYFTNFLPKISPLGFLFGAISFLYTNKANEKSKASKDGLPATLFFIFAISHVLVLSAIAHKEWRFVIYTIPLLNISAALTLSKVLANDHFRIKSAVVLFLFLGCVLAGFLMSYISSHNYPGGYALQEFHGLLKSQSPTLKQPIKVHMDVYTAMNGASRFLQAPCCTYFKNESHTSPLDYLDYDWVITSTPKLHLTQNHSWSTLGSVRGYNGLSFGNPLEWLGKLWSNIVIKGQMRHLDLPIKINFAEKIFILKRNI